MIKLELTRGELEIVLAALQDNRIQQRQELGIAIQNGDKTAAETGDLIQFKGITGRIFDAEITFTFVKKDIKFHTVTLIYNNDAVVIRDTDIIRNGEVK